MGGTSWNALDAWAVEVVRRRVPELNHVVDFGPGSGKWGRLLHPLNRSMRLVGIELCTDYELPKEYDTYVHVDVLSYRTDEVPDLVVAGDVLEHLRWSQTMDWLHLWAERARWLLLAWPTGMPQSGPGADTPWEAHQCQLRLQDLLRFRIREYACVDMPTPDPQLQTVTWVQQYHAVLIEGQPYLEV